MKTPIQKAPTVFLGFVGGVIFIISCGSGTNDSLINKVDAAVPETVDQMVCKVWHQKLFEQTSQDSITFPDFECQLKSETMPTKRYINVSAVFADGWTVISAGGGSTGILVFHK